jgi:hypothetical protein
VSSVRSAGARRSCNVNARWRLVDFLTMETTVPRPQVLAMPPARARAHPKHDPMLTHHSAPCAPAGQPAVLLQCIFVAPSSRKPRVSCRRAEAGIMRPREQQWAAGAPAERDVGHGCARAARLPHARAWLCGLFAAPMRALVCMSARILVSRPAHQPMVPHRARGGGFRRQLNAYNMCIHTKTTERGPQETHPKITFAAPQENGRGPPPCEPQVRDRALGGAACEDWARLCARRALVHACAPWCSRHGRHRPLGGQLSLLPR